MIPFTNHIKQAGDLEGLRDAKRNLERKLSDFGSFLWLTSTALR